MNGYQTQQATEARDRRGRQALHGHALARGREAYREGQTARARAQLEGFAWRRGQRFLPGPVPARLKIFSVGLGLAL